MGAEALVQHLLRVLIIYVYVMDDVTPAWRQGNGHPRAHAAALHLAHQGEPGLAFERTFIWNLLNLNH